MTDNEKLEAAIDEALDKYLACDHDLQSPNYSGWPMSMCDVCRGRYSEESFEAGYRAGLEAGEKDENGLKQLTPTPECECELRNRQWNGYGKCLTCKRRYKAPYPYKQ